MSDENKARVTALMSEISANDTPKAETPAAPAEQQEVSAREAGEVAEPASTPEGEGAEQVEGEGSPGDGRKPLSELSELEKAQHAFQRKTNKLTRRIGERDMRIAELEERLASLSVQEKPQQQVQVQNSDEPTLESCDFDVSEFNRRHYQWLRQQERQQEQVQQRAQRLAEKEAAFAAEHPYYFEATRAAHVPITDMVAEALLETDDPAGIAYYLANNLDEAHAIARMTPINAARAIGRIEAKLSAPPPVTPPSPPQTVTRAPAVAPSVSARAPASKPVSEMSVEDHLERLRVKQSR